MEIPNGKTQGLQSVQIAVLETKLDAIQEALERIENRQVADSQTLVTWQITIETRLTSGSHRLDSLERFDKAVVLVAGAVGTLVLGLLWAMLTDQAMLVFP